MYQNLALGQGFSDEGFRFSDNRSESEIGESVLSENRKPKTENGLPCSVHLCDYPTADTSLLDADLNLRMASAQKVVRLGHKLREESNLRVRQPLAELRFASSNASTAAAIEKLADVIGEELNIQKVIRQDNLDSLVKYAYKPNLKTLGPKYGKLLNACRTKLHGTRRRVNWHRCAAARI
jgi:isoleucyl-tRNA synthetase